MIRTRFLPKLEDSFASALGTKAGWQVGLDPDDVDGQTVLSHYPAGIAGSGDPAARYLRPVVRLELGARGEQWPAERSTIASYAAQAIPKPFKEPECTVPVLSAERTFWEKATILHALFHSPADKPLRDRQSRHYYDVVKLYEKGPGKKALGDLSLLASVVKHKAVFFQSAAAKYDEAVPCTLRLVPPPSRKKELETDYARMREMIFGVPPSFDDIIAALEDIERQVNKKS
ncbi:MAG: nucleotidyl transferase AbiEii/AbiGii toxin family protein [Elusimicrobiota bacterium]